MDALVIIPARVGSKGIPHKNFTPLNGVEPWLRAVHVACLAGFTREQIVVTTDCPTAFSQCATTLRRPDELAQDDTPMTLVIQHVLANTTGDRDQKVLLVQPTQPLREPKHLTQALGLLTPEVDSVVSVMELPRTHHPYFQFNITGDRLYGRAYHHHAQMPTVRQEVAPTFIREGAVYAFWRRTFLDHANIYGDRVRPLIVPPEETQALDTLADWREAERRLRGRET